MGPVTLWPTIGLECISRARAAEIGLVNILSMRERQLCLSPFFAPQQKGNRTMPIDFDSPLLALVRRTKRYSICERQPGDFEVIDNRYLLDYLLKLPELRPTTNDLQVEFDEALKALGPGPTLSLEDNAMLEWLETTVGALDPNGKNTAYDAAYKGALLFAGTVGQVEDFMNAALDHRLQPAPYWVQQ
jgi:hypothetical protein